LILELALTVFLTTRGTTEKAPSPTEPPPKVLIGGPELARAIKTDIEAIAGPGSVDVSIDHETLYTVRVAVPGYRKELYDPIYSHALKLYRDFPELSFDFYLRPKTTTTHHAQR
jgi:hypothetical protein